MIFFDRQDECNDLWRHFSNGKNILMLAPRRVGKTMLLNQLKSQSAQYQYRTVMLEVAGFDEEKAFFRHMCATLQEELDVGKQIVTGLTARLKQILNNSDSKTWRELLLQVEWDIFAEQLLSHLTEESQETPCLILIDELPIFIIDLLAKENGENRVRQFLYTLRRLQQKYSQIRWLYAGSIGLDTIARRHGLEGTLVDMEIYPIKPFDSDTAARFIAHLIKRHNRHPSTDFSNRVIERLQWLAPYYLEKIAEDASNLVQRDATLEKAHADQAMDAMLSLSKRTYWATWREHLDKNFIDPERTYLFTILETIAVAPNCSAGTDLLLTRLNSTGETVGAQQLRDYLDTLVADGYLVTEQSPTCTTYRFLMGLLCEWWQRYVVGNHI